MKYKFVPISQRKPLRWPNGKRLAVKAKEVVETAYHFAGGTAIFENQPFERRLRDVHAATQQVPAQFVNFEVAGQVLLGLPVTSK